MLLIADSDLRDNPQGVMDRLCDFVALPRVDLSAVLGPGGSAAAARAGTAAPAVADIPALISELIDTAYPKFERSGWRLDGDYPPMDPAIEARLRAFYAPYNAALFEYLGYTLPWK